MRWHLAMIDCERHADPREVLSDALAREADVLAGIQRSKELSNFESFSDLTRGRSVKGFLSVRRLIRLHPDVVRKK
jgi:hypothetical protein